METKEFINHEQISNLLASSKEVDKKEVTDILDKALSIKGLSMKEVATLAAIEDPELLDSLFKTANQVKELIYGKRLVIFAPLYISNLCNNECLYCAFRAKNKAISRRALSYEEITKETEELLKQGQKRVLLVAGESYPQEGFNYVLNAIDTVYDASYNGHQIRRININVAPLTIDEFKALKEKNVGTYQIFQETYHPTTYAKMHVGGQKRNYNWRITATDRAMMAGIDDVGIGILFGLYDWRYEILALMQHINHLEQTFGIGPHTLSVPRLEPASGAIYAENPPYPVSDDDFKKIIAILRLAVPYTGIILSTRENAETRRNSLSLGISQISAGSRTNPGGYNVASQEHGNQFSLGDHRSLDDVVADIANMGYLPSFCTACYRLGRTGDEFMKLAKPGDIKKHCEINALATFQEYLSDFASEKTKQAGEEAISQYIEGMSSQARQTVQKLTEKIKIEGQRDLFN